MKERLSPTEFLDCFSSRLPIFQEIQTYGRANQVPILSDAAGRALAMLVGLFRPERILEIGCGISYSTHWMLTASESSQIIALDTNLVRLGLSERFLTRSRLLPRVELVHQAGLEYLTQSKALYDLIFIDSTKKGYAELLDECYKHLSPEGLIIADNIFFGGLMFYPDLSLVPRNKAGVRQMQNFCARASSHPRLDCYFLELGDGLMVARKK